LIEEKSIAYWDSRRIAIKLIPRKEKTMAEVVLTDGNWEEKVLKASSPVMVDLWAEWCAPCKMIGPAVEEIAESYEGKLTVGKLNIDENPNTPGKYGIMGIPTLLFFKNGELIDRIVGVVPKDAIEKKVKQLLG
jgi:thioredoxin 1